jgi:hypothetical protein
MREREGEETVEEEHCFFVRDGWVRPCWTHEARDDGRGQHASARGHAGMTARA